MEAQAKSLTPLEYCQQWRDARVSRKTEQIYCPPDSACMLSGHSNDQFKKPQNQDRIYLPYRLAWRHRRSVGYVANLRYETQGTNAQMPASAQIVVKILFTNPRTGVGDFVYGRVTAYASAYAPRSTGPCNFAHIRLGDLVSGIIEAPSSDQCSTSLLAWDAPDISILQQIHGPQLPRYHEIILEPKIVGDLPQIGGSNFWPCPNHSSLVSLRFELPPADLNQFKRDHTFSKKSMPAETSTREVKWPQTNTIPENSVVDHPPQDMDSARLNQALRRECAIKILTATVQDVEAFPADRARAEQILLEAGEVINRENPSAEAA